MDETILEEHLLEENHSWDEVEKALEAFMYHLENTFSAKDDVIDAIDTVLANLPGRKTHER